MQLRNVVASVALAVLLVSSPTGAQQLQIGSRAANITFGGNLQTQYSISSVDAANNDFFTRRARLMADVSVNEFVGGRVQLDFAGGAVAFKDVLMRLNVAEGVVVSIGQFKRSFDIFELASSTDLSLIERDGRVEGYSNCTGVGSICSYSRFTESLGFADRDTGIRVEGVSGRVRYQASFTNGTGSQDPDENDTKSASGRVTFGVSDDVRVSGQIGLHDYVDTSGNETAVAFGADVEVGTWRDGLLVQAAVVTGDNWRSLSPTLDPATFVTFQGVASYYYPLTGRRFGGLEPLIRLSWGDPDTDTDDDGGMLVTPGLMLYIVGRNKIGANFDIYSPQTGDMEFSFKVQTFLYY